MTTRRGFLGGLAGILAAGFAPAAIGSQVLMPVRQIITPPRIASVTRVGEAGCLHSSSLIQGDIFTISGMTDAKGRPMQFLVTQTMPDGAEYMNLNAGL